MWYLVLLFMNPATQTFDVANGWAPIAMETSTKCEMRAGYVLQYLPRYTNDMQFIVDCIQASSMEEAIAIAKE